MDISTLLIIAILLGYGVLTYISYKRYNKRLQRLNNSRPPLTREEYVNTLVQKGFDKKHVEVMYDQLKILIDRDDFSIYPQDDIVDLFGIDELDMADTIDNICIELNLRETQPEDYQVFDKNTIAVTSEFILTLIKNIAEEEKQ